VSSDHRDESDLNALRTDSRADTSAAVDATSALRDRLRLRLTVHNVVPVQPGALAEPARGEPGERVWNSVLESLSTSLHSVNGSTPSVPNEITPPPIIAPPHISQPVPIQPSIPVTQQLLPSPSFSPQPLNMQQASGSPAHQQPSLHAVGGQIYVPAGLTDYQPVDGNVALLTGPPQVDPSLFISGPTSIVTPNIGGTGVPYLGQPIRPAGPQRVVPSRIASAQLPAQPVHQRKRHPFRAFFSFLVVASLLAGAGFTGWYFLIKKKVTWSEDVTPLATFVEDVAHTKFVENVPVTTLSVPEYEVKLGIDVLARSYSDANGNFDTLRAVGLVSGVPSPSEVGHLAAVTMTAFYSPGDRTIYRIDGTTPAFELGTLRALSAALADQKTDWSKGLAALTDAQRVGIRAAVDGVGAEVVRAKFKQDPQLEGLVAFEVQARTTAVGVAADKRPTYLNAVLGSYFFGAHASPAPTPDHLLSGIYIPGSDAPLFDPSRSSTAPAVLPPAPIVGSVQRTMGLQFWYLVLLPAIGAVDARSAALTWTGDSLVTSTTDGHACIAANISTPSATEQAALAAAIGRWAQTRPVSSAIQVSSLPDNVVGLSACEPAEPTAQPTGPGDATLLYSTPLQEESVGADLIRLGLPQTQGAWSCAIAMVRFGALPNFVEGSTDPAQAEAMAKVLDYCKTS
jgi:hypothetical protein